MGNSAGFDEKQLVRDIMQGNRVAMQELYSRTVGVMTAVCSRYVVDPDDVKDVLQESYLKVFTGISAFTPHNDGSLQAWVRRIVVNESLQLLRRKKSLDAFVQIDDIIDEQDDLAVDEELSAQAKTMAIEDLMALVQELPVGYRTIFNLFAIEKQPHSTIAKMLGISESTSASQYHRARKLLAKRIMGIKNKEL